MWKNNIKEKAVISTLSFFFLPSLAFISPFLFWSDFDVLSDPLHISLSSTLSSAISFLYRSVSSVTIYRKWRFYFPLSYKHTHNLHVEQPVVFCLNASLVIICLTTIAPSKQGTVNRIVSLSAFRKYSHPWTFSTFCCGIKNVFNRNFFCQRSIRNSL